MSNIYQISTQASGILHIEKSYTSLVPILGAMVAFEVFMVVFVISTLQKGKDAVVMKRILPFTPLFTVLLFCGVFGWKFSVDVDAKAHLLTRSAQFFNFAPSQEQFGFDRIDRAVVEADRTGQRLILKLKNGDEKKSFGLVSDFNRGAEDAASAINEALHSDPAGIRADSEKLFPGYYKMLHEQEEFVKKLNAQKAERM